jgi:hypothetical protein
MHVRMVPILRHGLLCFYESGTPARQELTPLSGWLISSSVRGAAQHGFPWGTSQAHGSLPVVILFILRNSALL